MARLLWPTFVVAASSSNCYSVAAAAFLLWLAAEIKEGTERGKGGAATASYASIARRFQSPPNTALADPCWDSETEGNLRGSKGSCQVKPLSHGALPRSELGKSERG